MWLPSSSILALRAGGSQGLCIRVARAVNRHLQRKGRLFAERYHARALKTPRAVKLALRYVLLNARKHERGQGGIAPGHVDPCSSAAWFDGFARPRELVFGARKLRGELWPRAGARDRAAHLAAARRLPARRAIRYR